MNEMVMGGGGTDSTVMNEATISPPKTTACATSAIGTVSHLRVRRFCLVENTIESNNRSPRVRCGTVSRGGERRRRGGRRNSRYPFLAITFLRCSSDCLMYLSASWVNLAKSSMLPMSCATFAFSRYRRLMYEVASK